MKTSSNRWIIAQEGSRQSYAVPVSFHRLGLLRMFYVDIWCRWGRSLLQHGSKGTRALASRYVAELPSNQVISFSPAALLTRTHDHFRRGRLSPAQMADIYNHFGEWFAQRVHDHLEKIELDSRRDLFFAFNTNCLETLTMLRRRQIFTVVDQVDPGLVEEEMVLEESERWPGWAKVPGRLPQSYWNRLKTEWDLADLVLVNSEWSAQALVKQGVPLEKQIIVPLAVDLSHEHAPDPVDATGRLKVLWLGNVILRKGIQYLVEAARLLEKHNIEFLIAGPLGISDTVVRSFPANIKILGRVTRDYLGDVYSQAHVFVLPTVSDGFAITQLEAMAHGLPVVTTPNCGRVVTDGKEGFIVPARDGKALADALAKLNDNRKLLREMSVQALGTVLKYDLPSNARLIDGLVNSYRARQTEQTVRRGETEPQPARAGKLAGHKNMGLPS